MQLPNRIILGVLIIVSMGFYAKTKDVLFADVVRIVVGGLLILIVPQMAVQAREEKIITPRKARMPRKADEVKTETETSVEIAQP